MEIIPNAQSNSTNRTLDSWGLRRDDMGFSVVFPKIASDFFFKRASYLRSFRFGAENCPEDDPRFAPRKKDLRPVAPQFVSCSTI